MRKSVDYELVERLLNDESLSFNQIADLAGCSSWSVRKFARELAGDTRPMKSGDHVPGWEREYDHAEAQNGGGSWVVVVIIAAVVLAIWFGARYTPPPEGGFMA
jgi:hypothetical protein